MTQSSLSYANISGADVDRILGKIEEILAGENINKVIVALLAGIILFQRPDVKLDSLLAGVRGASEWIVTFLASLDEPTDPKELN